MTLLLVFCIRGYAMKDNTSIPLLYSAKTKGEITEWAKDNYGPSKIIPLTVDNKKALVVLGDTAFGLSRLLIHVYIYSQISKQWDLFLLRHTNTSDVSVRVEDGNILFLSKSKKVLFIQPIDTFTLDFQKNEQ